MLPGGFYDFLFDGFYGNFRGISEMGYFMIDPVLKGGEKGKKILLFSRSSSTSRLSGLRLSIVYTMLSFIVKFIITKS